MVDRKAGREREGKTCSKGRRWDSNAGRYGKALAPVMRALPYEPLGCTLSRVSNRVGRCAFRPGETSPDQAGPVLASTGEQPAAGLPLSISPHQIVCSAPPPTELQAVDLFDSGAGC